MVQKFERVQWVHGFIGFNRFKRFSMVQGFQAAPSRAGTLGRAGMKVK
jgi:hypothetical protein